MGRARPRVTFVTYEASRTGSPILLLRFLRWLRAHADLDTEVICWRGGPLVDDFREVAQVRVLGPLGARTLVETAGIGANEVGLHRIARWLEQARLALALRRRPSPDLIYLNGVPSFVSLPYLQPRDAPVPVLAHIHELEFALSRSLPPGEQGRLHDADRYVAVARAVAENLTVHHGIPEERVSVVHGFVDDQPTEQGDVAVHLRRRLGIPASAAVVGSVGDLIWRKGPDLFLRVAAGVTTSQGQPVHFVWVGGQSGRGSHAEVHNDRTAMGLDGRVHLVDEQDDVADWYALFDLLLITSREDPFPLVMLEAAQANVPVVSFDGGGASEFLRSDQQGAGVLIERRDTDAMASAVEALLGDERRRGELAQRAAAQIEGHFRTAVVAPRLLAEIEGLL